MTTHARNSALFALCGFFLAADQLFKWLATNSWQTTNLINRFVGWDPFYNPGVAFGIPIPNSLILALTAPILGILGAVLYKKYSAADGSSTEFLALSALFFGALSNAIDRTLYHHTVDYIRIIISIFNIGDVLIVTGFVLYFWKIQNTKQKAPTT